MNSWWHHKSDFNQEQALKPAKIRALLGYAMPAASLRMVTERANLKVFRQPQGCWLLSLQQLSEHFRLHFAPNSM